VKIAVIALTNLRRLTRDRVGLFFVFVFPLVVIVTIGSVFGSGFTPRMGLLAEGGGPLQQRLIEEIGRIDDLELVSYDEEQALITDVERGELEGGVVIPDGYDRAVESGDAGRLEFFARPNSFEALSVQTAVSAAIADQNALLKAARFSEREGIGSFADALARAESLQASVPTVGTELRYAGAAASDEDAGAFDQGAAQQLILFVFLTSLSAASQLIQTRRLGLSRRMISTPTSVRTVLLGETLGRFVIAMVQGVFIVGASALLFGVGWGDPLGTSLVVVLFALVSSGAAMLFGAMLENDEQAASAGVFAGLGLAALGGCMVPLEVFPDTMRTIAHLIPHAWAVQALDDLVTEGAAAADVLTEIGVLAAFAAGLLTIATWRLHRTIVD
jgi:linearmycin/streptolysin S transport system permease protein